MLTVADVLTSAVVTVNLDTSTHEIATLLRDADNVPGVRAVEDHLMVMSPDFYSF